MKKLLWLDDIRSPFENNGEWLVFSPLEQPYEVIWVKSYDEFINWIITNGLPEGVCFDHDLGLPNQLKWRAKGKSKRESRRLARLEEKTGYDCAKWLSDFCIDNELQLPLYNIQSANSVGKENIDSYLKNHIKIFNK